MSELRALQRATPIRKPSKQQESFAPAPEETDGKKKGRPPQRDLLISYVEAENAEFWHDKHKEACVTVVVDGHQEHYRVRSREFRLWLQQLYLERADSGIGDQAVKEAINTFEAKAIFKGSLHEVGLRVLKRGDTTYIDLGNKDWRVVEVTKDGWKVIQNPPVKFVRTSAMQPLPVPVEGGVDAFKAFANLFRLAPDSREWILIKAFMHMCLNPQGPYPVLVVSAEQGAGKTTLCKILKLCIDPNHADLRSVPREERDFLIAANNSWLIVFDNLSGIRKDLSDCICRLATGGGNTYRRNFTDDEEQVFRVCRPQVINGIGDLVTRGDLIERALIVSLPNISEADRRTEKEILERFMELHPQILGALFDAAVAALKNHDTTKLKEKPRMADFAQWVAAAEPELGLKKGDFMKTFKNNQEDSTRMILESDVVAEFVLDWIKGYSGLYDERTATDWLKQMRSSFSEDRQKLNELPRNAIQLSNRLKRLNPALRKTGIEVVWPDRLKSKRGIKIYHRTTGEKANDDD